MFGIFAEKCDCPSCGREFKVSANKIKVSRSRHIQVVSCPSCNTDFVKNKRSELFPILEEGVVLV